MPWNQGTRIFRMRGYIHEHAYGQGMSMRTGRAGASCIYPILKFWFLGSILINPLSNQ